MLIKNPKTMKIWKEFGSSHSENVSIIGTFTKIEDAKEALPVIEDFVLGAWEERYPSLNDFLEKWAMKFHPDIKYIGLSQGDYELGVDNEPKINMRDEQISITRLRTSNVGGIVRLLLFAGAKSTLVENNG